VLKSAHARQAGPGLRFEITTGSGHVVVVDDATGDTGPRPAELLLVAQAGCTALDVASILAKKRQSVTAYGVSVAGVQRDDPHPHVYERIDIVHEVEGPGVETAAVQRAIELSATRYCTVSAMLASGVAEIHHCFVIRRPGEADEAGEVLVTGPHREPGADAPSPATPAGAAA